MLLDDAPGAGADGLEWLTEFRADGRVPPTLVLSDTGGEDMAVKAVKAGKFPGTDAGIGIAGGAPGTNAIVESGRAWTVIVLSNVDPPVAENIGQRLASVLSQ